MDNINQNKIEKSNLPCSECGKYSNEDYIEEDKQEDIEDNIHYFNNNKSLPVLCRKCKKNNINCIIFYCKCCILCIDCAEEISREDGKCPVCRMHIGDIKRIFYTDY